MCKKLLWRLAIFFLLLGGTAQLRAMDVFLFLENLPGESLDANHKDWIDLYSLSHGVSRAFNSATPSHSSLMVQKRLDKTSPKLDLFCNKGTVIPTATIEFTRLVDQEFRFYKIQLTNVIVSSVQDSGSYSGDDFIFETVSLNYESIQWDYTPLKPNGSPDIDVITWWNIPLNKGGTVVPSPDNDQDGIPDDSDPDDDNDGMTDVYETANGLNPFVNDATGDLDHDGMTNYNEFIAGTSANNANSVFRVTRTASESGNVRITWLSVAGKTYEVHSSSELNGPYAFLATVSSAGTGETSTVIAAGGARKYFQIRVLP